MNTKNITPLLLTASALSLINLSAMASGEESEETIEEYVIWGTKVQSTSYLNNEQIEVKQADHISDLLRPIPGVDVGGAHSLNQRITIRSMDDKDLKITIDGANQNTYMYHHMGNLQIHADILESADVEVGTNSVINGGLGGSVRFETKSAEDLLQDGQDFGGRLRTSYGDNSGASHSATAYGQLSDTFDFLAYYNAVDRKNYEVGGGVIKDANGDQIAGTDGTVRGLEGDLSDALIKFGWDVSPDQRLKFGYESYEDEGDYSYRPDMGLATDLAITESLQVPLLWPTEFTRETYTLNYDLNWGDNSLLKATVFANDSTLKRDESGYAQNPAYESWAAIVEGNAENKGINLLAETDIGASNQLTYGLDVVEYNTEYTANYITGGIDNSSEKATNTALYIQDKILVSEQFSIIPGLRYDSFDIETTVINDTFDNISGALAFEFYATNDLLFKLSATELFKGPEIGETFTGAGLFDTPNPGIEAETGLNTELSFAYQTNTSRDSSFSIGATIFNTKIDDYIYDYAENPSGGYWKDNIGDMTIDGYETYIGFDNGPWKLFASYSSADSELDAFADYSSLENARLDRKQGDTLSANLGYDITSANLSFNWEVMTVKDLPAGLDLDGASLDNSKDGFTVHNIAAYWQPTENLGVIVGIDNVFDEFYASQSSRTGVSFHPRFGELYLQDFEPGRNIKATLSYNF